MDDWDVLYDMEPDHHFDGSDIDDAQTEFENVFCLKETPKALLVKLDDGLERWLPKKALRSESEVQRPGDKGTLEIHGWFAKTWEEEEEREAEKAKPFEVEGLSIVMRQTDKAILVKLPDGREMWFPLGHIDESSELKYDGDSGKLVISDWIAGEKKLK